MRILKVFLVIAVVAALLQSPTVTGAFRAGFAEARANATEADAVKDLSTTTDRLCPVFAAYLHADGATRTQTADALRTVATVTRREVTDPTARTLLAAVPDALDTHNTHRRRAARALLRYTCAR